MKTLEMVNMLAVAGTSGEGMIHQIGYFLIIGICLMVLWLIGWWVIKSFAPNGGATAQKVWMGLFILLGGLALINFLLSLIDKPFIRW